MFAKRNLLALCWSAATDCFDTCSVSLFTTCARLACLSPSFCAQDLLHKTGLTDLYLTRTANAMVGAQVIVLSALQQQGYTGSFSGSAGASGGGGTSGSGSAWTIASSAGALHRRQQQAAPSSSVQQQQQQAASPAVKGKSQLKKAISSRMKREVIRGHASMLAVYSRKLAVRKLR